MFNKSLGLALGTVSAIALGSAAFAQSSDDNQTDDNVVIIEEGEDAQASEDGQTAESQDQMNQDTQAATTAAPVAGGQVQVEQGQPRVSVTVADPDVDVDQARPQVDVEQPQPEITVAVPEPTVRVQQQAPIITVEQAQPEVTVSIPEPVITIRVPRPNVNVDQSNPDVNVEMPEPVVNFVRPEPRINIQEAQPRVVMQNSDGSESNVDVQRSEGAEIDVNQAEPEVDIQEAGEAQVEVTQADPEVTVEDGPAADVNVNQSEAEVQLSYETDEQGNMASEEDRQAYQQSMEQSPFRDVRLGDIEGQPVTGANDERVGEVDQVGTRGETVVLIIGVGGFLGMGERTIALPLDRVSLVDGRIVLDNMTAEELESMPEYNEDEFQAGEPDQTVGNLVTVD
ncbi:PRC-barrel domain-containing protein [Citreimonas sp.]|uniref:PRC-barrel domain-containing protein n=1 Tax=Citreimonas sp. TaxID=3036715 RepID=UPI004057E823